MIDKAKLTKFERGCSTDFTGEVFFGELQSVLGEDIFDRLIVRCHGMNKRVMSHDVLSVDMCVKTIGSEVKEYVQLDLARNSIYHQLPESLFHPLVISAPGMSNKEIVDAIRNNEKQDKELTEFFSPFDTAFFIERVNIQNRHLQLFTDKHSRRNLFHLVDIIVGNELELTYSQKYRLFRCLCNSEQFKENLPLIEKLFSDVFEWRVTLKEIENLLDAEVFEPLGESVLGFNSGFNGSVISETLDIQALLHVDSVLEQIDDIHKMQNIIQRVIDFFVISSRHIEVRYVADSEYDLILGENRLGFDTNL